MSSDAEYIKNYRIKRVYVNPAEGKGAFASICDDIHETVLGEIELVNKTRVAVSAFLKAGSREPSTIKIHLLRHRKNSGWYWVEELKLNGFDARKVRDLLAILSSLDIEPTERVRVDLPAISLDDLLEFEESSSIIKDLAQDPRFKKDVFAIGAKRLVLQEFRKKLDAETRETEWQIFFEENPWIFGFGLNYVFLDKVGRKFEQTTKGHSFDSKGKRSDGLARTRAEISQTVLIEIKSNFTKLLRTKYYRPGVWPVSDEVNSAVTQSQKTVFDFVKSQSPRIDLKDENGDFTSEMTYRISPRAYLVVGNLNELIDNEDKITSFELYRKGLNSPEIITFDELYFRAKELVSSLEN
ncbi:Shedu immune nuclease family protein [Litoreibacter janthinus]|uniref:Shedu protein SduA C-terminal domain-containing protein n=1 Tax=Litoreibacter janthinus TaxID=670154 RepID=A0A1I6HQF7_9RHOB|nr:Shedu immune nuclease family protein [Litoreibacter janthinus]SFR56686.1 protein of unknown function [Litoreibacter janthinus]